MKKKSQYSRAMLLLALSMGTVTASAQYRVSGQVTDAASHAPLAGVRVASAQTKVLTDEQGRYSLQVNSLSETLTASRNGYTASVKPLQGDTLANISLYAKAFRPALADDAYSVAATELSVEEVLATRSGADVRTVSRSALPGIGANMFIRGYNTLNGNSQPLVVVDGVIWDSQNATSTLFEGHTENPLADIDVNDIEKVEVLKDATSIYGAKGANGAIVITTKRSHSIVTKIDVDLSYGFKWAPKTYEMMNAAQCRTYLSEAMKNSPQAASLATSYQTWLNGDRNALDYNTYHNETDWADQVYRTGNLQRYGIRVEGSDDVADYAISVGYSQSDATVKSVDFSRLNARINAGIKVLDNFSIGTNMMFSYLTRNMQDDGVVSNTSPTFISAIKSPFLAPYSYTDDGSQLTNTLNDVDVMGVSNPNAIIAKAKNTDVHYRFGIGMAPQWNICQELTLSGHFNYQFVNTKEHYFSPMTGVSPVVVEGNTWENTVKDQSAKRNTIYGDVKLDFRQTKGRSEYGASLMARTLHTAMKYSYADGHNTGNDEVSNLNSSLQYRSVAGVDTDWSNAALTLQADYCYDHRYQLWATITEEASSRFGKDADASFRMLGGSWATFPSVGAKWYLANEKFMRSLPFISQADIHLSYGVSGNDDMDAMSRYAYLVATRYLGNATGLTLGGLANEKLKWEVTKKFNVGLQLSFFDNRLSLSADYFHHVTDDLLNYREANILTGQEMALFNGGKLKNVGYELSVGARPIVLKNFSWYTQLSMAHYKNTIEELPAGDYTTDILGGQVLTAVGQPAAVFYGYKTQGVFATQQEAEAANLKVQNANASYSSFAAGDVKFIDKSGDGIINDDDRQVIGDPNPTLTGSFFNRFAYKRFSLELLCSFSLGGDIYNYQRQQLESMSTTWNQTTAVLNRWKGEGQQTFMPKAVYGDPMGNSRFSDRWIEDGGYFKLKNIKLSYELPISSTYIHGLTLWMAVENLVTFTKYLGVDPEVSMNSSVLYQGIDNGMLAAGRAFHIGTKINL